MKIIFTISALLMLSLLPGCASMVSQTEWPITVKSNPNGAVFSVTNRKGEKVLTGTTPATIYLSGSSGFFSREIYSLHFSKGGYTQTPIQEKTVTLQANINPWYWGNIPTGPLGFLLADPYTGAMFKLPRSFHIDLINQTEATHPDDHK